MVNLHVFICISNWNSRVCNMLKLRCANKNRFKAWPLIRNSYEFPAIMPILIIYRKFIKTSSFFIWLQMHLEQKHRWHRCLILSIKIPSNIDTNGNNNIQHIISQMRYNIHTHIHTRQLILPEGINECRLD